MKRILLLVVLCAFVSLVGAAQEKNTSNPFEEAVLKVEQQWEDALIKSDAAALENIYDETLIYTHSSGSVDSKATYIKAIKSGALKYTYMKRDDIKVSVYHDTAVVTCHSDFHVQGKGNTIDINARCLHVYVKQKDGWKMVAHQSTRLPQ